MSTLSDLIVEDTFSELLAEYIGVEEYRGIHKLPDYLQYPVGIGGLACRDDVTAYRIKPAIARDLQIGEVCLPELIIRLFI